MVIYEWFLNKAVTEDFLGGLGGWSLMGGGHLREVVAPGGSTEYKYPSKGR